MDWRWEVEFGRLPSDIRRFELLVDPFAGSAQVSTWQSLQRRSRDLSQGDPSQPH
jgi:hypothetical protein